MWFYKQAQQVPQTPQREVVEKTEVRQVHNAHQIPQKEVVEKTETRQEHHNHHYGREIVHAAEEAVKSAERGLEDIAEHTGPAADWFVDIVRPFERKLENVAEEKIENLMDKNGWWKDDQSR